MAAQLGTLPDAELKVIEVLWELGPCTVRQAQEQLDRWAYTTVQTLLTRLEAKGYVASDRRGAAHIFRPLVSRDALIRHRLRDLVETLAEGAASPLLLNLVQDYQLSPQEIEQLRQQLDQLESEARGSSRAPQRKKRSSRGQ